MKEKKSYLYIGIVIIVISIILGYSKFKEYNTIKDSLVFSKDNIFAIWRVKKDENMHDYNYQLESDKIDYLSDLLSNAKLTKASVNDGASSRLGSITVLLDGSLDGPGVKYKRGITLLNINTNSVYAIVEANRLNDKGAFNSRGYIQKFYIIDSKELVKFINDNT